MKRFNLLFSLGIMLILSSISWADIPKRINFQGILTDAGGNPLGDSNVSVLFTIYDSPGGVTSKWSETQSFTTDSAGQFSIILGTITPIADTVFTGAGRYLGIKVGSDAEMSPRQQLVSLPYAYESAQWTSAGENLFRLNGNVGIGTASPAAKLHVHTDAEGIRIQGNTSGVSNSAWMGFRDGAGTNIGYVGDGSSGNNNVYLGALIGDVVLYTSGGEVLTVDSSGYVGIGTTNPLAPLHVKGHFRVETVDYTVAILDRTGGDGTLMSFYRDGIIQGNISVSGPTVSYNAFTGSHYGWTEEELERGELVSLTGLNRNAHDNPKSEVIYGIKRSTIPNDPACLGSYLSLSEPAHPASSENPHLVMAVGNGDMWVVDEGGDIQPGDFLISSSTAGHAMKDNPGEIPTGLRDSPGRRAG